MTEAGGRQQTAAVLELPETRYAKTRDGLHLAYQVSGDAPFDLVFMPQGGSHVELAWEVPGLARAFEHLAAFSRVIRFDHAGTGMSDPLGRFEQRTVEARSEEVLAVLDAVDSSRAMLVANNAAGLTAIFFAATYPNRTASLVLDGCWARLARAPDYPFGIPSDVLEQAVASVGARGASDPVDYTSLRYLAPEAMKDPEFFAQFKRYHRNTSSPSAAGLVGEFAAYADVRPLLPAIQAPTLVLYRKGDQLAGKAHATYLAQHIPDATLVEVPGHDNLMWVGNNYADLEEIEEFLTGVRHVQATDRVLATVLFTDIVGSTELAGQLGDWRWRDMLDAHDRAVRRQLERFRGREVNTAGDGFLATFDGPGRAIECGCAIRDAVKALGIEVRVGVHTGEIEMRGEDVAGMAVHIGARVAAIAGPGQVLVSSTVKDLVAGSGIAFEDQGEHELKGLPGSWRLYGVNA